MCHYHWVGHDRSTKAMIEKYLNYGECEICHENKPRLMIADICEECLVDYIKATEV